MPLIDLPLGAQLDSPNAPRQLVDLPPGAELDPPKQDGGIGSALSEAGKFAFTAGARGLGGLADFATDPLSPIRRMIDPRLENMEQGIRPHPGQAAGDLAFKATGVPEYQPTTPGGRVGLAAAEGAVGGGPFGIGGAIGGAISGLLGQGTQELTGNERLATAAGLAPGVLAPPMRGMVNSVVGKARETFGPALSQSYREGLAGEQLRNAASDLGALKDKLGIDQVGPLNQSLVPGSAPTTFQFTGDTGIGQLERGARTQNAAPFLDRMAEQNKARVDQVGALAPENAAPVAVRDLLKKHLDALDTEAEANISRAKQNATQAFDMVGGQNTPDLYGALMRDQLEGAKSIAKRNESKLWKAIDPEGKLTIDASPVREAAGNILSEIPRTARPPEGEEAAILGLATTSNGAVPFSDFAALRGRLLQAVREERANGQTPALRRMQMLREAMDNTISSAAENAAQADAGLLGRISGDLSDFGTAAEARTGTGGYDSPGASTVSGGYASTASGIPGAASNTARGFGGSQGYSRSQAPQKPQDIVEFLISRGGVRDDGGELRAMDANRVNGGYGTGGVGQGAFGILSRGKGLPPDHAREIAQEAGYLRPGSTISDLYDAIHDSTRGIPHYADADADIVANWEHYQKTGEAAPSFDPIAPANFDQAAATRYRQAANATRDRAQTYNNQIVGPALQERGSEYRMLDSRVAEQFLRTPEGVQAFLAGGGDAATLRDALAADLRRSASNSDGAISPTKFAAWQSRRAAALRAFPELQQTLGNAAKAQEAVDAVSAAARQRTLEFQKGAARHFLNAEPDKAVQSAFASKNPVADFRDLARLVGGDAEAKAGLQRAVAEHIVRNYIGNTEAGTSGVGAMKSDAFQTFIRRNGSALSQIFTPQQVQAIRAVATDLQRSNRSIAGSKIPGQSNTAQDTALQGGKLSVLREHLSDMAASAAGGLAGYLVGNMPGALVGMQTGVAKAALARMKAAGIEKASQLVTDALLNPELARTLLLKANPASRPFIARSLRTTFGRIAAASASREAADDQKQ